jgi:hypothetical protein
MRSPKVMLQFMVGGELRCSLWPNCSPMVELYSGQGVVEVLSDHEVYSTANSGSAVSSDSFLVL